MRRLALCALVLAASPVGAQNLTGFCLDTREEGCMPRHIAFAGNTIDFCEESCTLTGATEVRGMDAALYDLQCRGDYGDIPDARVLLLRQQNPVAGTITLWITATDSYQIVPCP